MAYLLELPIEIASLVVGSCDQSTLLALCLTSKSCQAIAQKILFGEVNLRTLTQCITCLRTILARPDLAVAIRDFLIMFDSKERIFPAFWNMLSSVLGLTENLISLHFAMQGPSSIVFRNCTFPRLRILSSVLDLSTELHNFLTRHPTIRQLCIGGEIPHQRLSLPAHALPGLETYLGSRSLARDVVPGRPVSHVTLAWTTRIPDIEVADVIRTLAMGTVPMRHFGCTTFGADANRSLILALALYMPGLHTLRINNVSSGRPTDEKFLPTVAVVVRSFKELKRLDIPCLVNANDDTYDTIQEETEAQLVFEWNKSCPSLEIVTFPSCMKWNLKRKERLWSREADEEAAAGSMLL